MFVFNDTLSQVDDQLVDDLDTLSKKSHIISTVEDDVPVINSDIQKRVEEQVDTPKDEVYVTSLLKCSKVMNLCTHLN